MPSKKKKYNARFPAGRIKKIMQSDEEVGKVAQAVPVIISRTLELFVDSLLTKTLRITNSRNAKTLSPSHMKQCIMDEQRFDFLRELVKNVPDISAADECGPILVDEEDDDESSEEMPPPSGTLPLRGTAATQANFNQGQREAVRIEGTNIGYDVNLPSTSTQAQQKHHTQQRKYSPVKGNVTNGDGSHLEIVDEPRRSPRLLASTHQREHPEQRPEKRSYSNTKLNQSIDGTDISTPGADRLLVYSPDEKKQKLHNNVYHSNYYNHNNNNNTNYSTSNCSSSGSSTIEDANPELILSPPNYETMKLKPAPIIKMDYSDKPIIKIDYSEIALPSTLRDTHDGSGLVNNIAAPNNSAAPAAPAATATTVATAPLPTPIMNIDRSEKTVDETELMIRTDAIAAAIAVPARETLIDLDLKPEKNLYPNIADTIIGQQSITHCHDTKVNSNLEELDEDYDDL